MGEEFFGALDIDAADRVAALVDGMGHIPRRDDWLMVADRVITELT